MRARKQCLPTGSLNAAVEKLQLHRADHLSLTTCILSICLKSSSNLRCGNLHCEKACGAEACGAQGLHSVQILDSIPNLSHQTGTAKGVTSGGRQTDRRRCPQKYHCVHASGKRASNKTTQHSHTLQPLPHLFAMNRW